MTEVEIAIPTEKSEPQVAMSDFRWLFHSFPKVGKTTLASNFPNAIFLPTEAGLKGLSVHKIPQDADRLKNWTEVGKAVKLLITEDHPFETVIIDTIDNLYQLLITQVARENSVDHISEMGYGAGWDEANKRLYSVLSDLYSEMGVVLLSHSRFEEVRLGARTITKTVPDLSTSPRRLVTGWVDIIVYLGIDEAESEEEHEETIEGRALKQRRVAICQPTPYVEAGGRLEKLPSQVSLGNSPSEGFDNLKEEFDEAAEAFLQSL